MKTANAMALSDWYAGIALTEDGDFDLVADVPVSEEPGENLVQVVVRCNGRSVAALTQDDELIYNGPDGWETVTAEVLSSLPLNR